MSDSLYAPPKAHLGAGHERLAHQFYVVSTLKMMVLMIGTLGLYALYWHYQNWLLYKHEAQRTQSPDADIWSVLRAVISPLYTRPLLREIEAHGKANARPMRGSVNTIAPVMVFLAILNYYLSFFVPEKSPYHDAANVAGLVILVPLMLSYRAAQRFINDSCGDPEGESNKRFTAANVAWLLIGGAIWVVGIHDMVTAADPELETASATVQRMVY
jgi:hypothetical protein